ncbi:MAG: TolC family protein [Bacteroidota bacterium]
MKKQFLLVLFSLLGAVFLTAQKSSYNIGVLLDIRTAELEPIFLDLQRQIEVVVGEDATIVFPAENVLVNNFDLKIAEENYNQLLTNNTDIILAFGVVNNVIVNRQTSYPKPTILFGAVNRDLVDVDLEKATSGVKNFTYLIESESFQDDLTKFKELTDFQKVGIVVEREIAGILPLEELFDKELKTLDAEYKMIPFQKVEDITSNLEDIDAVYLAGGFFLTNDEIKDLAQVFIEKKLPSFTNTGKQDVELGLFATGQGEENFDQFMRRIALNVEAYVNGTDLSELPIFIKYNPRLIINYNTAELVNVPIKYSLIATTDFVGEFKNAISEVEYDLLSAIAQGLDKNLSLAINQKDVELAEQDVRFAKSNYLPLVTTAVNATYVDPDAAANSFGQNPEFSTGGNIAVQQTVFSPAINANVDIQNLLLKAQEASLDVNELDIIFDVANAYFNTLILKTNAQIQIRNLDLTKRNLQIAEQNFDAGQSGKSDVLRFRSEMAQNMQSMVQAVNQMEQGFIGLNQVLNNPLNLEIDVEDVDIGVGVFERYNYDELTALLDDPQLREPFIEFLVKEAFKNAPELRSLDFNQQANERSIELYDKGRYYPTVALQGQYNRTFSRHGAGSDGFQGQPLLNDNYNVGANVSIPIFNQNQNNINQQTAEIQREQLNINQASIEQGISTNVRLNVLSLTNQVSNITLSEVSENAAREALELTQVAYSSGSVNIIQLIDAQNNFLNAQLARANAVYNFLFDAIRLERSIGYYFLLNTEEENALFRQRFVSFMNDNRN